MTAVADVYFPSIIHSEVRGFDVDVASSDGSTTLYHHSIQNQVVPTMQDYLVIIYFVNMIELFANATKTRKRVS